MLSLLKPENIPESYKTQQNKSQRGFILNFVRTKS